MNKFMTKASKFLQTIRELLPFFLLVGGIIFWMLMMGGGMGGGGNAHSHNNDVDEWLTATNENSGFTIKYPPCSQVWIFDENGYRGDRNLRLGVGESLSRGFRFKVHQYPFGNLSMKATQALADRLLYRIHSPEDVELIETADLDNNILRRSFRIMDEYRGEEAYIIRAHDVIMIDFTLPDYVIHSTYEHYSEDFDIILENFVSLEQR